MAKLFSQLTKSFRNLHQVSTKIADLGMWLLKRGNQKIIQLCTTPIAQEHGLLQRVIFLDTWVISYQCFLSPYCRLYSLFHWCIFPLLSIIVYPTTYFLNTQRGVLQYFQ